MQKELVILVAGKGFAQLLQCPFSCGMFGDIEVNETSGSDLKGDKDIDDPEVCRDGDEEIAGYDPLRLILKKG